MESLPGSCTTQSAEETVGIGRELARLIHPPSLILLRGDLGAGKTTLVKGIVEGFDAAHADDVTSPTFTIVHEYRSADIDLYHIDLYRIDTPAELENLGLNDLRSSRSVLLVEWGEKFRSLRDESDLEISIEAVGESARRLQFRSDARH